MAEDLFRLFSARVKDLSKYLFSITALLFLISFIYYLGFTLTEETKIFFTSVFRIIFLILAISKFIPEFISLEFKGFFTTIFRVLFLLLTVGVFYSNFILEGSDKSFWSILNGNTIILSTIFLLCLSEIKRLFDNITNFNIPPAFVFSISFLIIIVAGTGLLMLPNSHTVPISLIDSFFTSVSAVCVTGLVVVDTSATFTQLGKIIILSLIQIGGLGIMTFTGFFSYIFTSRATFQQRLLLKDLFSSNSLSNLFKILTKIILFTFLIEIVGSLIIFINLDENTPDRILFSAFHSISAFCNAGFSTISDGMYSSVLRDNYGFQFVIAILIILGGIGFPVLLKIYALAKHLFLVFIRRIRRKRKPVLADKFEVGDKIVLLTTLSLIIAGSLLYYFFEKGNNAEEMGNFKKMFTAFFNSVTARTAGFNINDITRFGYPAVFLTILLMWIGASPGSTGGGIKTTTFALALKVAWSNIRGKQVVEIYNREISSGTISRVLSIVILSILFIVSGFFCLLLTEPDKNPVYLLYESVSAFSTVGLSIAGTSSFSAAGKLILIFLMFIGRVGPLTLLTGFLISGSKKYYKFPETAIPIN